MYVKTVQNQRLLVGLLNTGIRDLLILFLEFLLPPPLPSLSPLPTFLVAMEQAGFPHEALGEMAACRLRMLGWFIFLSITTSQRRCHAKISLSRDLMVLCTTQEQRMELTILCYFASHEEMLFTCYTPSLCFCLQPYTRNRGSGLFWDKALFHASETEK